MQICTWLQWRNAMFSKWRFRIEGSDCLHLPALSLLCAWARNLKTRTQTRQEIDTYVRPASEAPVNQKKYIIFNTLHLHPAQSRKRTKKELPNSCIKLLNYRHPIVRFLQKTRVRFLQKTVETCNQVCRVLRSSGKNSKETRWQFSWKNPKFSWWVQSVVYPQIMCFPWLF